MATTIDLLDSVNQKYDNGTSGLTATQVQDAIDELADSGGGGATIADDTTTDATYYPTFATATSGSFDTATVSSTKLTFNPSTGQLSATDLNSLSDKRLKKNIKDINSNVIDMLNPVSFNWKDTDKKAFGLIAQDVQSIIPQIVNENDEGILSISYIQLIPFLIKEIQNLKKEIEVLKKA